MVPVPDGDLLFNGWHHFTHYLYQEMKYFLLCISTLFSLNGISQTLGGSSVFSFVNLPATPQTAALGGINISNQNNDAGITYNNPALIRKELHAQLSTNFNFFYAGISNLHLQQVLYAEKIKTGFALGINYLNYGSIPQTDAAGNELGTFRPNDFVIQLSAVRQYEERWHYGLALKFIQSNYGLYKSNAIAFDLGLTYTDTSRGFQVGFVAKNMGGQLRAYDQTSKDEIPFDVQLGISKRLKKAPIQFSATAYHLSRWDLQYNDTLFNNETGASAKTQGSFSVDNIFRHFVFAAQAYIGQHIEVTLAYNYLRRQELKLSTAANGLNGFSLGAGLIFSKLQFRYARSYYQNTTAFNQVGVNIKLNEYFGLGKGILK